MPKHYRPAGKKKEGNAAKYVTRTQAVKLLQVSLPVFRKLCILKGVFPREPKKNVNGNCQSCFHMKDNMFLKNDPLLGKLRDIRAYEKKVKKAKSKKNWDLAQRLLSRKPCYTLERLVKERYPSFIDALRDLDDCLNMVHLFAALPAVDRAVCGEKIPVQTVHKCRKYCRSSLYRVLKIFDQNYVSCIFKPMLVLFICLIDACRLSHEWQSYISHTHKLRKTFISVKGIYYQAEVCGQTIKWLTPHALQQVLPPEVDYRIMLTFLELYETLLTYINYKLYTSINVEYPPILDPRLDALGADLYALSRYIDANATSVKTKAGTSSASEQEMDNADEDNEDAETRECKNLFKNMKFFLSREAPRESLLFIIPAFGGTVSWECEGAPFEETDQSITHQVVDRPKQERKFLSREYIQPQWVYDCVNARFILPTEKYMVGRIPPPHLSPFVNNEEEGHVPEYAEAIERLKAAERKEVLPLPGMGKEDLDDPQSLGDIIDRAETIEAAKRKQKMSILEKQYHEELKLELQGVHYSAVYSDFGGRGTEGDTLPDLQKLAEDAANMSKVMMPCRKKKLLEAMEIGKERKRAHVHLLKERKKKIDEARKYA